MSNEKRSKKILILATALMLVALGAVIAVYATSILGTFTGGNVTVVQIGAQVNYSTDNDPLGTWTTTLTTDPGSNWYTELAITSGYTGSATVTFQLQELSGSNWQNTSNGAFTTGTVSFRDQLRLFMQHPVAVTAAT